MISVVTKNNKIIKKKRESVACYRWCQTRHMWTVGQYAILSLAVSQNLCQTIKSSTSWVQHLSTSQFMTLLSIKILSPCFAWHRYGKLGLFNTELVIVLKPIAYVAPSSLIKYASHVFISVG